MSVRKKENDRIIKIYRRLRRRRVRVRERKEGDGMNFWYGCDLVYM